MKLWRKSRYKKALEEYKFYREILMDLIQKDFGKMDQNELLKHQKAIEDNEIKWKTHNLKYNTLLQVILRHYFRGFIVGLF